MSVLTNVLTTCNNSHMNTTQVTEVRFTAKRACYWDNASHRWITIARETAADMIALGTAVELKAGQWI